MKKLISILAALAVVTTCSVGAMAADFTVPEDLSTVTKYEKATEGDNAGLYSVDLSGVANGQEQTTILAVKGDTIAVGTIEYIGQSADTTFNFDLRNTLADGETVYVLAGGSDIDAQVVGYMGGETTSTPEVEKITISGTVSGWAGSTLPTVTLYNGETEVATAEVTASETTGTANFTVEVDKLAEGSYTLKATRTGHTAYTLTDITVEKTDVAGKMLAGDVDDSGLVDGIDLGLLLPGYSKDANDSKYVHAANFDESNLIDGIDLGLMLTNYSDPAITESAASTAE